MLCNPNINNFHQCRVLHYQDYFLTEFSRFRCGFGHKIFFLNIKFLLLSITLRKPNRQRHMHIYNSLVSHCQKLEFRSKKHQGNRFWKCLTDLVPSSTVSQLSLDRRWVHHCLVDCDDAIHQCNCQFNGFIEPTQSNSRANMTSTVISSKSSAYHRTNIAKHHVQMWSPYLENSLRHCYTVV